VISALPRVARATAPVALAFLIAVSAAPPVGRAQAPTVRPRDAWFGPDKVKHFFIAAFVESVSFSALESAGAGRSSALPAAVSVAAAVSVGREVHDGRTKGLFSIRDLAYDALGAAAAFIVLRRTQH